MGIFDIIGPVMIGPSSSHTAGAARIGRMAREILGEPVVKAKITLYGSFSDTGKGHGTDKALAAGLMGYLPESEEIRDALQIAKDKGIDMEFVFSNEEPAHPNTAFIQAQGKSGHESDILGVSLGGGRIKITEIDGISVEITGEEYTLITNHYDVPGIVAAVSSRLANHNINISNMRVFRKKKGLNAVMIVHTDQEVPESMIKELVDCNKNIKRVISLGII
ncbi:L-serine ammonia-lyase, iron-sulfur-dependent subunit beta [Dialister micraerophilus]|uniref:L-serine ammonia-lyase, iron-sulfur-dependent subunit beta n=1 Tax=Dialister micraerophilus TaxID=309120 RepID=UPI0023F4840A|nr:L-serine ammonia-lyase, iron-sulfur-dependent subunit beta [Dialister micraerophilus]